MKIHLLQILCLLFGYLAITPSYAKAEPHDAKVSTSLFWKGSDKYLNAVDAKVADLYKEIGHHGPAVENPWVAYRMYFNDSLSMDILSKFQARIELPRSQWYGSKKPELANLGYGKDNYKVNKTVGIGGVRLWHKGQVINVKAQGGRSAQVESTAKDASFSVTSRQVELDGKDLDITVKVSVSADKRYAKVELSTSNQQQVQFVTGLTYHNKLQVVENDNFLLTWGDYDSPAANEAFNVGAAIIADPSLIAQKIKQQDQWLWVSKPTNSFSYYITSANEKERQGINTLAGFTQHVQSIHYR